MSYFGFWQHNFGVCLGLHLVFLLPTLAVAMGKMLWWLDVKEREEAEHGE